MNVKHCFGEEVKRVKYTGFELSITKYQPNQILDFHYHENPYLSMLLFGGYYEKNEFSSTLVCSGDMIRRPQEYLHHNQFSDKTSLCFNIEFNNKCGDVDWIKIINRNNSFKKCESAKLKTFKLFSAFSNDESNLQVESLLTEVLNEDNEGATSRTDNVAKWLDKLREYIHAHKNQYISLSELSNVVNISPIYMARAFKSRFGMTIGRYQQMIHTGNALSQILDGRKPLTEIAYENGFCDQSHMIKQIALATGLSPMKIRKQIKKFI